MKWMAAALLTVCIGAVQAQVPQRDWRGAALASMQVPALAEEASPPVFALVRFNAPPIVPSTTHEERRVMLAVWPSGRIIWSSPEAAGGRLLEAILPSPEVQSTLDQLSAEGVFNPEAANRALLIPDAGTSNLFIRHGIRRVGWGFPRDPTLLTSDAPALTARGLEPLEGRTRELLLAQRPATFQMAHRAWTNAATAMRGLIPVGGSAISPEVVRFRSITLMQR